MFHYFHKHDGFFDHYYRIEGKLFLVNVTYRNSLHINASSPLINQVDLELDSTYHEIDESKWNEILRQTGESLGIQLKTFKFV